MMKKKATINDVAELAGVSISSVSRYMKDPKSIRPLAAYNIKVAIKELDYRPNAFAQRLKGGKSRMIGLVVPHMENFYSNICKTINEYFFERNYTTFICETDNEGEKEKMYIEELINQRAAGIIVSSSGNNPLFLNEVVRKYKNIVLIDRFEDLDCHIVMENHKKNAYDLMNYLLENKPCDKILILFAWSETRNTKMFLEGSSCAIKNSGKNEENIYKVITGRESDNVNKALRKFLAKIKKGERPAIVAIGSDILELLVIELHKNFPEWIDKIDIAGFSQEGIKEKLSIDGSFILKNPDEEGIVAAETLYRIIKNCEKTDFSEDRIHEIEVVYDF